MVNEEFQSFSAEMAAYNEGTYAIDESSFLMDDPESYVLESSYQEGEWGSIYGDQVDDYASQDYAQDPSSAYADPSGVTSYDVSADTAPGGVPSSPWPADPYQQMQDYGGGMPTDAQAQAAAGQAFAESDDLYAIDAGTTAETTWEEPETVWAEQPMVYQEQPQPTSPIPPPSPPSPSLQQQQQQQQIQAQAQAQKSGQGSGTWVARDTWGDDEEEGDEGGVRPTSSSPAMGYRPTSAPAPQNSPPPSAPPPSRPGWGSSTGTTPEGGTAFPQSAWPAAGTPGQPTSTPRAASPTGGSTSGAARAGTAGTASAWPTARPASPGAGNPGAPMWGVPASALPPQAAQPPPQQQQPPPTTPGSSGDVGGGGPEGSGFYEAEYDELSASRPSQDPARASPELRDPRPSAPPGTAISAYDGTTGFPESAGGGGGGVGALEEAGGGTGDVGVGVGMGSGATADDLARLGLVEPLESLYEDESGVQPAYGRYKEKDPVDAELVPELIRNAEEAVMQHEPVLFLDARTGWTVATVPREPVAGAPMQIYFNRAQSAGLAHRPTVLCLLGYNDWEQAGETVELMPVPGVVRSPGVDWWCVSLRIPEEVFDVKFVFTDGDECFDNNDGNDYALPVLGGITSGDWENMKKMAAEEEERAARHALRMAAEHIGRQKARDLKQQIVTSQNRVRQAGVSGLRGNVWEVVPGRESSSRNSNNSYGGGSNGERHFTIWYKAEGRILEHCSQNGIICQWGINDWNQKVEEECQRAVDDPKMPPNFGGTQHIFKLEVTVPKEACTLDFVFHAGDVWDNNDTRDFGCDIGLPEGFRTVDDVCRGLEDEYARREWAEREAADKAEKLRIATRKKKLEKQRSEALAVVRRQQRHVLYTVPEEPRAGDQVTIHYDPTETTLSGATSVYLKGGFNRWQHEMMFGPVLMTPPTAAMGGRMGSSSSGGHWTATVTVPEDAYKMDFVFCNSDGPDAQFDSKGGYDYHVPIKDAIAVEPPLHICHIAVEMAPVAKVGGLGDVVTSLARAVQDLGHKVEIILPGFRFFNHSALLESRTLEAEFDWGGTHVYVTSCIVEEVRVFFVCPQNGMMETDTVYQAYGDEVRFDFFCKAALEFLLKTGRQPDILHCHDWSTAHVAPSYWADYHEFGLWKPRVVFTIHNLEFGQARIGAAAFAAQKFTTVSPTYASEIAGHQVIAPNIGKFVGVRNGIDIEIWDPETDIFLPKGYNVDNVVEGKRAARKALCERVGMAFMDKPLVGVISRLTNQKGVHLIQHTAHRATDRGAQFILLGSAPDPEIQKRFDAFAQQIQNDNCRFEFKYDEPLSHLIYAAADFLVVPSMFEPCGLTQLTAMRYGTIPVVRHTGGLRDTVFDVDNDKARAAWDLAGSSDYEKEPREYTNGFAFEGTDEGSLDYALNRALERYWNNTAEIRELQKRCMEQDWSWNRPALDYLELYHQAKNASL